MITEALKNPMGLFNVEGKSALITGASGAFGRAVAISLGAMGANLTLVGGTKSELDKVADECRTVGANVQMLYLRPDTLEDAEKMVNAAVETFGDLDQLIVASGANKPGFIQDLDYEDWQFVMDANIRGAWFMAKAAGSYWIEKGKAGKVLLVSSVRGRFGNTSGYTGYCPSKGATDMLTRVLATEWGQYGTTVNAIAPTVFRSKLTAWMYDENNELGQATKARSLSRIPLGRLGEPEDFVGMALYLLSDASSFCTGQIMYVDGGFSAG